MPLEIRYKSNRGVGLVGILLRYSKYVSRKKDAMRLDVRRDIVKKIIGTEFNVKCRALQTAPIFKGVRQPPSDLEVVAVREVM